MKRIILNLLAIALLATTAIFQGCVKGDPDMPPVNIPHVDFPANKTIAELTNSYTGNFTEITDSIVIKGIVVGNDESGNIYKYIVIQDETGGIVIELDRASLFNDFRLGQRVYVKCQGMYIGDYNGLIQLGYIYDNAIGRLPQNFINSHIFPDSLPGNVPAAVEVSMNDNLLPKVSTLVKFTNVHFSQPGYLWAEQTASATSRQLLDADGNAIDVRTSKYATFASDSIPYGTGTVTGILSVYNDTYQLTIRDTSDVQDFNGVAPPPGSGTGTFDDPYNVSYAIAHTGKAGVWVQGYIVGVFETDVDPFTANFTAPFRTNSNILIANTPDETNLINCVPVQLPTGTIREALNLVSNEANKGKQVMVLGNIENYFSQPGVKSLTGYWLDGSGIIPATGFFTEEFTSTLGQFTPYSVSGDQTWIWATYDGGCAKMSGYSGGSNNANEDWLISAPVSLSGKTGVKMSFREAINYITSIDDMKVLISTNYDGTSNPNTATWTELTGFTRSAGSSFTFVESGDVSLATWEGQTVRIAFKYNCSATASATWEIGKVLLISDKK
ncbi:MAG: DUF5689 domain-containing protein [Lentimicrobiaceae bacterium]|nr:DUF5689 domain-containing protein [Lentimicrobiaceae bacterium]